MRDCTNCIHVNVCRIHRSIHAAAWDFEQLLPVDACHEQIGYGRHKLMLDRITPAISEGCRFWQAGEPADANQNIPYDRATGQPSQAEGA
jgi:hypothetical protein